MLLFMPLMADASGINFTLVDGIYYEFNKYTHQAYVSCKGFDFRIDTDVDDYMVRDITQKYSAGYSGSLVIPSEVTYNGVTYPVTGINYYAFGGCSGLTSITIPSSVTFIWDSAFDGCSELTSITIPESVKSIGNKAFKDCSSLTSITIPSSLTDIGVNSFEGSAWYENQPDGLFYINNILFGYKGAKPSGAVSIKDGTTRIGARAFSECTELNSISIPESVTSIGDNAFYNCSGLTSISIPESVTSIGYRAFSECTELTSISIPESVTSIGYGAFKNCSSLTSISFSGGITTLESSLFDGTAWYNNLPDGIVYVDKIAYEYKGTMPDNTSITIKEGTVKIFDCAFLGCSGLTSITIPESVKSIGYSAFNGCSGLTEVIALPTTPPSINTSSFPYDNSQKMFDEKIKLMVPESASEAYLSTSLWNQFATIETLEGGSTERLKCATPTISFNKGQITFTCETEGVTYNYSISSLGGGSGTSTGSGSVNLGSGVTVSVYATKTGYSNSDTATLTLPISMKGDVNGDGQVNAADHVELTNIIMNP